MFSQPSPSNRAGRINDVTISDNGDEEAGMSGCGNEVHIESYKSDTHDGWAQLYACKR